MRSLVALVMAVLFIAIGTPALAAGSPDIRHVVVIDQSGSMEPFLHHPAQRLVKLMETLMNTEGAFSKKDRVAVMLFSEEKGAVPSPQTLFRGTVGELRAAPAKVNAGLKSVPQWTELIHGLKAAVAEAQQSKPGEATIIWFLTDNVSEGAGGRERNDTLAYYKALKDDPQFKGFTEIMVFPLDLQHPTVKQGLMLYAMLWDPSASADLSSAYHAVTAKLAEAKLPEMMGAQPLLVKPLDERPFRLELTEFTPEGSTKALPVKVKDGKVVLPGGKFSEGQVIKGTLSGRLISNYESFKIPKATLQASLSDPRTIDFKPVKPGLQKIEGAELGEIGAKGTSQPFAIKLELPSLHATWNWQSLLGTAGNVETDLKLGATLTGGLAIDTSRIGHLTFHGMTELPGLFAQDVKLLTVDTVLQIPVKYSGMRFIAGVGGFILGAVLLVALLLWVYRLLTTRWEWTLAAPDNSESVLLFRRWHKKELVIWDGRVVGTLKLTSPMTVAFFPDGEGETEWLDGGGSFTASVDGKYCTFRVDPRIPDTGGDDDDVAEA